MGPTRLRSGGDGTSSKIANLLVVEDDPGLGAAIRAALEEEHYSVRLAPDGETALAASRCEHFDAALVDLLLPGVGGHEVCQLLRSVEPRMVILVITALGAPDEIIAGFEAGADDYLVKPFGLAELRARLHALLRRGAPTGRRQQSARTDDDEVGAGAPPPSERVPETLVVAGLRLDRLSGLAWSGSRPIALRPRERAVLELLMQRPGLVLTRRTVRAALWGPDATVSDTAVEHHVSGLRRALGAADVPCVIETVYGIGWRLRVKER